MIDELRRIAAGGEMDVVVALRQMAAQMVILDERIARTVDRVDPEAPAMAADPGVESDTGLRADGFDELPARLKTALWKAGYTTLAEIAAATDAQLAAINGVGPGTLKGLRKVAPKTESRS